MLTRADIMQALKKGKLIPVKPIAPWAGEPRAFLMCEPLYQSIEHGKTASDEKERQRWATLEGAMAYFVEGGLVTDDLLKQLIPPKFEHWELISRRPRPSLRVFGRFAEPNVFVGTHVCERKGLGGMWSPEFEHQKLVCEDHWKASGLEEPFSSPPGFPYDAYVTENARKKVRVPK